ncbi:hypothetical protein A2U01_0101520, partial [Trifolium medium]|nr:hypothetical protein [Trifolium medium]
MNAGVEQGEVELRRVRVKISAENLAFWNLRATQGYRRVALFIWQAADVFSGKCASRRVL